MAVTATLRRSFTLDGVTVSQPLNTYVDDRVEKYSGSIAAGTVSNKLGISFIRTAVMAFVIDAKAAMTVWTNNAAQASGIDVFHVAPNAEVVWWKDSPVALPLTADVTGMWAANAGTNAAVLDVVVLVHAET